MTVSPDLDLRFREAASTLGLVDIGYDLVESPIGELLVAASDRGVASIWFDPDPAEDLERLARIGPARSPLPAQRRSRAPRSSTSTSPASDAPSTSTSTCAPCRRSRARSSRSPRVPYGETTTYGALAQRSATLGPRVPSAP